MTVRKASSEQTRLALIEAGLHLFGNKGFEASSTRDIAAAAKANIGSIAYHFGGKEGLRLACAHHIVTSVRSLAEPLMAGGEPDPTPEAAARRLSQALTTLGTFLVADPRAGLLVQFILRELSQPSPALDVIYEGVFAPVHARLCRVWEAMTGEDAESQQTRLTVFSLIGQIVYFRIGREAVMRRMGWTEIGPKEAARITEIVGNNVAAIVAAHRAGKSEP